MKLNNKTIGQLFLITALALLLIGLFFGLLSSVCYALPNFLKGQLGFEILRPLHVSSAIFWIILGATGAVYSGLFYECEKETSHRSLIIQWLLWIVALIGIFYSYINKDFGGREYWEFNPKWAFPIALAWIIFLFNFIRIVKHIRSWPVYIWMWLTGILFFLFTFLENYLWLFPYFRDNFILDMTVQWKANGSLVGSWNQLLYGTAFFLMDRIDNTHGVGRSKIAFFMYFLGLFNLMFNWGHHIYTLPTAPYIRYIGYIVSMTEWIFLIRIIYCWRKSLSNMQKHYHFFPYRFIMAADIWIILNMAQAILMSIPALNIYTHGTHITVAHAMGTTIGINSMILLAACFEFLIGTKKHQPPGTVLNSSYWILQGSLLILWLSLNLAGIKKAIWQMQENQSSYSNMMESLSPYFVFLFVSGMAIFVSLGVIAFHILRNHYFDHDEIKCTNN